MFLYLSQTAGTSLFKGKGTRACARTRSNTAVNQWVTTRKHSNARTLEPRTRILKHCVLELLEDTLKHTCHVCDTAELSIQTHSERSNTLKHSNARKQGRSNTHSNAKVIQ